MVRGARAHGLDGMPCRTPARTFGSRGSFARDAAPAAPRTWWLFFAPDWSWCRAWSCSCPTTTPPAPPPPPPPPASCCSTTTTTHLPCLMSCRCHGVSCPVVSVISWLLFSWFPSLVGAHAFSSFPHSPPAPRYSALPPPHAHHAPPPPHCHRFSTFCRHGALGHLLSSHGSFLFRHLIVPGPCRSVRAFYYTTLSARFALPRPHHHPPRRGCVLPWTGFPLLPCCHPRCVPAVTFPLAFPVVPHPLPTHLPPPRSAAATTTTRVAGLPVVVRAWTALSRGCVLFVACAPTRWRSAVADFRGAGRPPFFSRVRVVRTLPPPCCSFVLRRVPAACHRGPGVVARGPVPCSCRRPPHLPHLPHPTCCTTISDLAHPPLQVFQCSCRLFFGHLFLMDGCSFPHGHGSFPHATTCTGWFLMVLMPDLFPAPPARTYPPAAVRPAHLPCTTYPHRLPAAARTATPPAAHVAVLCSAVRSLFASSSGTVFRALVGSWRRCRLVFCHAATCTAPPAARTRAAAARARLSFARTHHVLLPAPRLSWCAHSTCPTSCPISWCRAAPPPFPHSTCACSFFHHHHLLHHHHHHLVFSFHLLIVMVVLMVMVMVMVMLIPMVGGWWMVVGHCIRMTW